MIITLLGMSGTGKSHWSRRLADQGYQRLCADDMVERNLETELLRIGYEGIHGVAKWMGQPYDPQYPRTCQAYLALEKAAMVEILGLLRRAPAGADIVVDTTGSVIYLTETVLSALSDLSTIVYLHTPESAYDAMAQLYADDPKPVIWGDSYRPEPSETPEQALARCYPELLRDRATKYKKHAHITFDYDELRTKHMTPQHILDRAASYERPL